MDAISALHAAIGRIKEPRLFATERGYQGMLATELDHLLDAQKWGIARPLVEQEYQKRATYHGIRLRPDIIVHIPFERGVSPTRQHDNYLVILIKLSAGKKRSEEDFTKLATICSILDYPIGAFVNIGSTALWLPNYAMKLGGDFSLHEYAVALNNDTLQIKNHIAKAP